MGNLQPFFSNQPNMGVFLGDGGFKFWLFTPQKQMEEVFVGGEWLVSKFDRFQCLNFYWKGGVGGHDSQRQQKKHKKLCKVSKCLLVNQPN